MRSTSRVRVALLLAITFLAGMAAGVAADRQFTSDPRVETTKQGREEARRDRRGGGTTIERFADEIGLSERQRADIDLILDDTREQMSDLFEPVRPRYREIIDSSRARIEALLTPEQVEEYRRLLDRGHRGDRRDRDRDEGKRGGTERE